MTRGFANILLQLQTIKYFGGKIISTSLFHCVYICVCQDVAMMLGCQGNNANLNELLVSVRRTRLKLQNRCFRLGSYHSTLCNL